MSFTQRVLKIVEPPIFHFRKVTLTLLSLLTLFLAWQAAQLQPSAGWLKMVPREHPYMQTFMQYYKDFGGANTVLIALKNKHGDIYNPAFMQALDSVTNEVFFVPGIDRARVTSIFTPNVYYIDVNEDGLAGGNVIPTDYKPTPEMMPIIRANVGRADVVGKLVSSDQTAALIVAELLEDQSNTDASAPVLTMREKLELLRQTWVDQFIGEGSKAPLSDRIDNFRRVAIAQFLHGSGGAEAKELNYGAVGDKLEQIRRKYETADISIGIVGFAVAVHEMTNATLEVGGFFLLSLLLTGVLLWMYLGSLRLAMLPMICSLVACTWEMGLLHWLGFGLDPFAILVPFLVLAVSVSHGVQYVNYWAGEVCKEGADSYHASLATFRRLAIAGTMAIMTDVVGFGTIYLINIQMIREMSINAALGMAAIIITNKVLMPELLSYLSLGDLAKFRQRQAQRERFGDGLWRFLAKATRRGPAIGILIVCAGLLAGSLYLYPKLQIGETQNGVPELRPESRFNQDAAVISANFSMSVDQFKIIAETQPDACIDYGIMSEIDRFSWYMRNQPGVRDTLSLLDLGKLAYSGLNEGRMNAEVMPRSPSSLAQATALVPTVTGLLNDDCSALPVWIFTVDHKAKTLEKLVDAVKYYQASLNKDSRIKFRLASGNVGVIAATDEVVKDKEFVIVGWVYAVIMLIVFLCFRTLSGVICVLLPLSLVSMMSYGLMVLLNIGEKVTTLPVIALATGIGVDYGIYIYSLLAEGLRNGLPLEQAYYETLRRTGKAVVFTGFALGVSVITWLFSKLQFQADMGVLLTFSFTANMLVAIIVLPALASFFAGEELKHADEDMTAGAASALKETRA